MMNAGPTWVVREIANQARILSDPSELVFSSNRQMSANAKDMFRTWEINFEGVYKTDYALFETFFQTVGRNKPFFVIFDSDDEDDTLYYVHLADDLSFQPLTKDWWSVGMVLEEEA